MYLPSYFAVDDLEEVAAFIQANAFGQLISSVEGRLFSSHIPFFLSSDKASLTCHVAKKNPQWKRIDGQEVLITFQGPHDYVSPSWYASSGVPTWNYQAVHVYGTPALITETAKLRSIVNELTRRHESSFARPWEPKFRDSMLNAIVGIRIMITEVQCKFKLSQNRSERDRLKVAEELGKHGSSGLSQAMKGSAE